MFRLEIFCLSDNILKRYENDWNNGTYFLYNMSNNEIWVGNSSAKLFIDLIDGKNSISTITAKMKDILDIDDINTLKKSIDVVLSELIQKSMIFEVSVK